MHMVTKAIKMTRSVTRSLEQEHDVGERLRSGLGRDPRTAHGAALVLVFAVACHADVVSAGEHDDVVVVGPDCGDVRVTANPARDGGVYGPDQRLHLGGVGTCVARGMLAGKAPVSRNRVHWCSDQVCRAHGALFSVLYI